MIHTALGVRPGGPMPVRSRSGAPAHRASGTCSEQRIAHSGDHGAWGWMVSPRASISTNWSMRLARVSGLLAFPMR